MITFQKNKELSWIGILIFKGIFEYYLNQKSKPVKNITQIENYNKEVLSFNMRNEVTATHDVYTLGEGRKVVIIIQELPGIGQETLSLADKFVAQDYIVVLPHLFGPIGKTSVVGNFVQVFCMRKEFTIFSKNKSSPIVDYLSGLCSLMKKRHKVNGVAVIGMCLTGNFAISLMANEDVLAGFASQPAMPVLSQGTLHMSNDEIVNIKRNIDKVGAVHCGRFEKDLLCTAKKFEVIDKAFNTDENKRIIFHVLPGKGHSILTVDFVDEEGHPTHKALNDVFDYFNSRLE